MKKRKIIINFLLLLTFVFGISANVSLANKTEASGALQQEIEITGTVTDAQSGEPLPGVNIVVQGTTTGTTTNMDGEYALEAPSDATLVFSFVGYQEVTVGIESRQQIDVEMEQAVTELEEVVAVGYATQRVGEVTGSVASVNSEDLEDMAAVDASEVLKGNVSGVTITESNTPGGGATIRIRGLGTINNNNPLWVVDGVPGANVNPNNIESISVLKDASAQAIYGARASNGVILVTTKSGKKGQDLQVNLRVKSGVTRNTNSYDLLNTQEYGEQLWLMAKNAGIENYSHVLYGSGDQPDIPEYINPPRAENVDHSLYDRQLLHEDGDDTFIIMKANKEGTNWLDEIDRDAVYEEYIMDVSGGSEDATYTFMANYLREEGLLKHTGFKRYNLRANITFEPTDWLEIGAKSGLTYQEDWGNQSDNNEFGPMSLAYRTQPIIPVRDVMGNFAGTRAPGTGNSLNPLFQLWSNQYDQYKNLNPNGNAYAEATIFEGLSFRSLFGFNYNANNNRNINYVEKARSERGTYDGLSESSSFGLQWNWSNTLEYNKTLNELHDVTIMLGSEAIENTSRWRGGSRDEFFSRNPLYMQLDAGVQNQSNYGNLSEWSLFSMFTRLNYNFDNKYMLGATLRRDASSRFGEDNRSGIFPSFSAGWRISNESFMAFSNSWLDDLKIRAGWGETGNDQIGNYNSFTTFNSSVWNSYYALTGINTGTPMSGFRRAAIGNPNVQWETTTTSNLGIDATFLENFDLSIDLWHRQTEDMLYPKQIPDVVRGQASVPSVNVGNMDNRGFDVELGYRGSALNDELNYNVSLNVSHYQNELKKLSDEEQEFIEGATARDMSYTRAETGRAFPEFYGYIVEGIFQSEEEANAHPPAFGEDGSYNQAGNFKYKDVNGDGVITTDDRTYIGSPHPDFTTGLNLNLQYKGFRLSTRLYSSYGNDMVNLVRRYIDFKMFQGNRSHRRLYESWGSPYLDNNENAKMPKAVFNDEGSQQPSTYFIEDASYLRMQNLRLSYNFAEVLQNSDFQNLQLYLQVTNLFTLTNYSGLDPEVNTSGMWNGIDYGAWPTPRQFIFGLNIGF